MTTGPHPGPDPGESPGSDFDNPWKEALDEAFEPFAALLFPAAYADVDWSRGYERLDKELREVARGAETGGREVDFLAKVWRRTGQEQWVLVHVEVQSQPDPGFPLRMFTYNYRLFDLYHRPVASFAVLADARRRWRPAAFGYTLWGCEVAFRFPAAKLLDFAARRAELEASDNVFATVVLAHLDTLATREDPERRRDAKFELVRRLYGRGLSRDRVRLLFRVIDWMMTLPKPLDAEFQQRLAMFEQEQKMPYVTSIERLAIEKGRAEGLAAGRTQGLIDGIEGILDVRFGRDGLDLMPEIRAIQNTARLQEILRAAKSAPSVADLRRDWLTPAAG